MKNNMNTTLELPEGSKAVISGKVIDGKNYLVVEVENEEQKEPEWTKFKRGDLLICPDAEKEIFVTFGEYVEGSNHTCFNCIFNSTGDTNTNWASSPFRKATKEEEKRLFKMSGGYHKCKWLREERGLEWDGEKLVEFLREGDLAIFWDSDPSLAFIAIYQHFVDGRYADHSALYWDNAIKWDGTKEQYERVLRGEI